MHDQALGIALLALLSNGDPAIFIDVIACLQAAGPRARTALPALEALLKSDDPGIRAQAGLAIVSIDGQETPRSVATLIRIVVDPKSPQDARESAIFLLREANRSVLASSTPNLIRQLADADAAVRQNAVSLLSMIIEDRPPSCRSRPTENNRRKEVRTSLGPDVCCEPPAENHGT